MTDYSQNPAGYRLAKRIALGLGTPHEPLADRSTAKGSLDYGLFAYATLPNAASVPLWSRAISVEYGPVYSDGTSWVSMQKFTGAQLATRAPAETLTGAQALVVVANGAATAGNAMLTTAQAASTVALLADLVSYPRPYTLAQVAGIEFTAAAATWNAGTRTVATASGGTKSRLNSDGVHGLTSASDGRYIYVSGTGITAGMYKLTYVSATAIDIDRTYTAATVPLISTVASSSTIYSVTIPAGAMGINGLVEVELFIECTAAETEKSVNMLFGGAGAGADVALNGTTVYNKQLRAKIANQGSASAQRVSHLVSDIPTISQATALTQNTATSLVLAIQGKVSAPDEFIRISSLQVTICPKA